MKMIASIFILYWLFINTNSSIQNSSIQPTIDSYEELKYLNCTNQTHNNTKFASNFYGSLIYSHTIFNYTIIEPDLCKGKVDIVIYVQTAFDHFTKRNIIRQTFGSLRSIFGKRIVLLFVVGVRPNDKKTQKRLLIESRVYRDVVQADFVDSYRNLTLKHLVALHWISNYCQQAKFISKTDDDIFINPFALIYALHFGQFNHTEPFVLGDIYKRELPLRWKRIKWYVTEEEYPMSLGLYPPYMKGYAYILSQAAIKPLWFCSYFRPYLFIDDLFITGLVVKSLNGYVKQYRYRNVPYHSLSHLNYLSATQHIDDIIFAMDGSSNATLWKLAWKNSLQSSMYYQEL